MFDIYPSNIETIINSELLYKDMLPLIGKTVVKEFNDKIYVINANLSINNCLVFDLDGNYVDGYSTLTSDQFYKGKSFSEWMKTC